MLFGYSLRPLPTPGAGIVWIDGGGNSEEQKDDTNVNNE